MLRRLFFRFVMTGGWANRYARVFMTGSCSTPGAGAGAPVVCAEAVAVAASAGSSRPICLREIFMAQPPVLAKATPKTAQREADGPVAYMSPAQGSVREAYTACRTGYIPDRP